MTEDLRKLYYSLGGTENCTCWSNYDLWREIAKLEGIDISNVTNINELLKLIEENTKAE